MAEVSVEINGRKYRMACEDGQEDHVRGLASRLNAQVEGFKGSFGEIGDNRLTVMAGIAVVDLLVEAEQKLDALRQELEELRQAGQAMAAEGDEMETRYAQKLEETARRIEVAASAIESAGRDGAESQ